MRDTEHMTPFGRGGIYTLAQNGTDNKQKAAIILNGQGSDILRKDYGKRKQKTKTITQALVLKMIDIAKQEGRRDIQISLWNTYYCQHTVYTSENRLYSSYCKNRFCTTCLGNRKAELIRKYSPVIANWPAPHFVTLTVKACTKNQLSKLLQLCIKSLSTIIDKHEHRHIRGKGNKLVGIRSLECNFNPGKKTYNPHFHLVVPDLETARIIVNEWLANKPTGYKSRYAQKIDRIENLETALIEVIKYGTKVFTDEAESEKTPGKGLKVYVRAFYNIIVAMKGLRLFASFGFKLPKETAQHPAGAKLTIDYEKWVYLPEYNDWQHTESELTLLGCMSPEAIQELLEGGVDMERE